MVLIQYYKGMGKIDQFQTKIKRTQATIVCIFIKMYYKMSYKSWVFYMCRGIILMFTHVYFSSR